MLKYIVVLASIAAVVNGLAIGPGGCPSVTLLPTFDSAKLAGDWYAVFRLGSPIDTGTCMKHSLMNIGFGHLLTTTYNSPATVKNSMLGASFRIGAAAPVQYFSLYPFTLLPIPMPYSLLNTDYTTYAVGYLCIDMGFISIRSIHIYVRDKANPTAGVTKAYADLDFQKIDRTSLQAIDQSCA